jgi:hypothetical protein
MTKQEQNTFTEAAHHCDGLGWESTARDLLDLRERLQSLEAVAEAGYELSRWAASINWDGTPNGKLWLKDLQRHIERVQELYPGSRAGMQVEPR